MFSLGSLCSLLGKLLTRRSNHLPPKDLERGLLFGVESQHGPKCGIIYLPRRGYPSIPFRCAYSVPSLCALGQLTGIVFGSFAGDFLAGITVASMLIPQSVSYASSLAKLSPVTGLVSTQTSGNGLKPYNHPLSD